MFNIPLTPPSDGVHRCAHAPRLLVQTKRLSDVRAKASSGNNYIACMALLDERLLLQNIAINTEERYSCSSGCPVRAREL